jgi:hypothetical protein
VLFTLTTATKNQIGDCVLDYNGEPSVFVMRIRLFCLSFPFPSRPVLPRLATSFIHSFVFLPSSIIPSFGTQFHFVPLNTSMHRHTLTNRYIRGRAEAHAQIHPPVVIQTPFRQSANQSINSKLSTFRPLDSSRLFFWRTTRCA